MTEPTLRKPLGILLMLILIAVWLGIVLIVAPYVLQWHGLIQAIFFTIAGTAWIFPLKPLLVWMETGHFR